MSRTKRGLLWLMAAPYVLAGTGNAFANWARLPLRFVFLAWAWWYTGPDADGA